MEMMERMSKRFWLLGLTGLVLVGLLLGCGTTYNSSSDGLVLVGSQGSSVVQSFSFNLNSGHVSSVANSTGDTGTQTCLMNGSPASMVIDASGSYAYVIFNASDQCPNATQTGIAVLQIKSDGSLTQVGDIVQPAQGNITISGQAPPNNTELVAVKPSMLYRDAAGKFLFVANRSTSDASNFFVPGSVSVFTIGSAGSLTEVAGSPFFTTPPFTSAGQSTNDIISVAATPTVFPGIGINGVQNASCSVGISPPTSEYLYAVDNIGNQVFEFQVDTSSGVLSPPGGLGSVPSFPADAQPTGVAVDLCARFVYVSGNLHNRVSAYTICFAVQMPTCPAADGSLVVVPGSPFALSGSANGAGPLVVDPFGNNVYVLGTLSNTISPFKISPVSGALSALNPATVATGTSPKSIAIRADDNWLFVANYGAATVSQYQVTPATGALATASPIDTDNLPWGVAVK